MNNDEVRATSGLKEPADVEAGTDKPAEQGTERKAKLDPGLAEVGWISSAAAELERELVDGARQ